QAPRVEPLLPMPAAVSAASEAHAIAADLIRQRLGEARRGARPRPPQAPAVASRRPPRSPAEHGEEQGEIVRVREKNEIKKLVADALSNSPQAQAQAQGAERTRYNFESNDEESPLAEAEAVSAPKRRTLGRRSDKSEGSNESAPSS